MNTHTCMYGILVGWLQNLITLTIRHPAVDDSPHHCRGPLQQRRSSSSPDRPGGQSSEDPRVKCHYRWQWASSCYEGCFMY